MTIGMIAWQTLPAQTKEAEISQLTDKILKAGETSNSAKMPNAFLIKEIAESEKENKMG